MKAKSLLLLGPEKLEWKNEKLRDINADELLVRTIAGAISIGSELPQFLGTDITDLYPVYPRMTGYESFGEVVGVGSGVIDFKVGDKVIASYGHRTHSIIEESKAIKVPQGIAASLALPVILSCDTAKGAFKLAPEQGSSILISGAGTMGLLTLFFIREYYGIKNVDIAEPNAERRRLAVELGARKAFTTTEAIDMNYDYGFECSGRNSGFQMLQRYVTKGGSICILSDGNYETFTLSPGFNSKELKIVASSDGWDYKEHARWYFDTIEKHTNLSKLFQYTTSQEKLIQCFRDLSNHSINPIKVLVEY